MAYTVPTAAQLKMRFPAFAAVDDPTVEYWLTDAQAIVKTSWIEADYAPAMMSLAAHNMALQGLGTSGGAVAGLGAMGVTDFKSAAMSVSFDAETIRAKSAGGYSSTVYGNAFAVYLRRNRGGPFTVSGTVTVEPCI